MEKLKFSFNWNNKLDCKSFTTIRLRNDKKYFVNAELDVLLKDENKGVHNVLAVKHFKIFEINEFIAQIDTGYSRDECIKTIQTMYKNISINWNTQDLSLILITKK